MVAPDNVAIIINFKSVPTYSDLAGSFSAAPCPSYGQS